jgi:hypothetical protein
MKKLLLVCALTVFAFVPALAADNPWIGTWKLDPAKSQLTGDTFTYSKAANGMMHYSDGSTINFDFGIDGKEYKAAYDRSTIWTVAGDNTWDTVVMANGAVLRKSRRQISADGKTLTLTVERTRPDGSTEKEVDVYTRETGTTGLIGKWRSTKISITAAQTYLLSSPAPGVIRMEYPEYKISIEGKADGTDHSVTGPDRPAGTTLSFKMVSPTELTYTSKFNGTPDAYGTQTLSADGKTLTDVSWRPGKESEKGTAVYIKQ